MPLLSLQAIIIYLGNNDPSRPAGVTGRENLFIKRFRSQPLHPLPRDVRRQGEVRRLGHLARGGQPMVE